MSNEVPQAVRYEKKPVSRLYIMGRLCDVFGVFCSGDEPYSGYWLEIDAVRDVETGEFWSNDDLDRHLSYDNYERTLADAVEASCREDCEQRDALNWPTFDYMRDVNPYPEFQATGEWP